MQSTFLLDLSIAVVVDDLYFDLHNDFDFTGFEYRVLERKARFEWQGTSRLVSELPARLTLTFEEVASLVVHRRDDEMPFTEDDCLHCMSYLPPELASIFDIACPDHRSDDEHFSFCFQAGAGIKVWAKSVWHQVDLG